MRSWLHRSLFRRLIIGWLLLSLGGAGLLLPLNGGATAIGETAMEDTLSPDHSAWERPAAACADHCSHAGQHLSGLPAESLRHDAPSPPASPTWQDEAAPSLSPPVPTRPPIVG